MSLSFSSSSCFVLLQLLVWWRRGRGDGEIVCLLWWWRGRGEGEIVCLLWRGRGEGEIVCLLWRGRGEGEIVCLLWRGRGEGEIVCLLWRGRGEGEIVCLFVFPTLANVLQAESEVAACMKKMFMGLAFPKPPDNITASVLFDKLEKKVEQEPSQSRLYVCVLFVCLKLCDLAETAFSLA